MSLFPRLARLAHPVGRAYSSFFSSKPGGGRHFVSAKTPKPVLQPGRTRVDNATPTESSPPANATRSVNAATTGEKSSSKPAETRPQSPPSSSVPPSFTYSSSFSGCFPIHPTISSKEYKLHQFFSLHRPLLLLDQPTSVIFEVADPSTALSASSEDETNNNSRLPFITIDNPPESSPEADADAARQLAYTLVMNRVRGATTWQRALSHLGLSAKCSENDMTLAKDSAHEWVSIHADSTRRKRRKKMKKHKLKKRRRLTRRQSK